MGQFIQDGDTMRELVEVQGEPCDGNESGIVRMYRDQVPEGAVIVGDEPDEPASTKTETKAEKKARLAAEAEAAKAAGGDTTGAGGAAPWQ